MELFDTRKALEEARKELSHALYQNDAAVRVIARLVMERDAARREVQLSIQANANAAAVGAHGNDSNKRQRVEEDSSAKTADAMPEEASAGTGAGGIPSVVKKQLKDTWEKLCKTRKAKTKATPSYATFDAIQSYQITGKKSYHKTSVKGIAGMVNDSENKNLIVTATKDKNLTVFDLEQDQVSQNISAKLALKDGNPSSIHGCEGTVALLGSNGKIQIYQKGSGDGAEFAPVEIVIDSDAVVEEDLVMVKVHPTGRHVFAAESNGKIHLFDIDNSIAKIAATWSAGDDEGKNKCTSIGIHPDGLILGIGREDGSINLWDLNTEKLAATLTDGAAAGPVTAIEFSEKGVHLASASKSGVTVWDLRKQKSIASLEHEGKEVTCMSFCPIGKYFSFGTVSGDVIVSVVKDWEKKIAFSDGKGKVSGLVWGLEAKSLLSSTDTSRIVKQWGEN